MQTLKYFYIAVMMLNTLLAICSIGQERPDAPVTASGVMILMIFNVGLIYLLLSL